MKLTGRAKLLRIFIGELDKVNYKPLYEEIVNLARHEGIAGATVIRGVLAYGASSIVHKAKVLALSSDLPLIIEITDNEEKIDAFIPVINDLFTKADCGGLITIENIEVICYRSTKFNNH